MCRGAVLKCTYQFGSTHKLTEERTYKFGSTEERILERTYERTYDFGSTYELLYVHFFAPGSYLTISKNIPISISLYHNFKSIP